MADKIRATQCENYFLGSGGGLCAGHGGRTDRHHVVQRSEPEEKCGACNGMGIVPNLPEPNMLQSIAEQEAEAPYRHGPPTVECGQCGGTGAHERFLADICPTCHRRIHHQIAPEDQERWPWLYRQRLPSGEYVYVECPNRAALEQLGMEQADVVDGPDDQAVIDLLLRQVWVENGDGRSVVPYDPDGGMPRTWRVARIASNCIEGYESQSIKEIKEAEIGVDIIKTGAWRVAEAVFNLEKMGDAWQLHGHRTKAAFARSLHLQPRTLEVYLRAERTLRLDHIRPDQRARLKSMPIRLSANINKPLTQMSTSQIDGLLDQAEHAPVDEVISVARTAVNALTSQREGYRHAEVTLTVAAATAVVEVPYLPGEDVVGKAKRQVEFSHPSWDVAWPEGDGQHTWEEIKEEE